MQHTGAIAPRTRGGLWLTAALTLIAPVIGRRLSLWHAVLLSLVTATVPGCKQSKTPSDADMAGTYALSRNTPEFVSDEFDYVGRVSAFDLRPNHTLSVTNFPLIKGSGYWAPGELIYQWTMDDQHPNAEGRMGNEPVRRSRDCFPDSRRGPYYGAHSSVGGGSDSHGELLEPPPLISYKRAD